MEIPLTMSSTNRKSSPTNLLSIIILLNNATINCQQYDPPRFPPTSQKSSIHTASGTLTDRHAARFTDRIYHTPTDSIVRRPLLRRRRNQQQQLSFEQHGQKRHHYNKRTLDEASTSSSPNQAYLQSHPYYPNLSQSTCINSQDVSPPDWMTWQGGYAETYLFKTKSDCCQQWFSQNSCADDAEEKQKDSSGSTTIENMGAKNTVKEEAIMEGMTSSITTIEELGKTRPVSVSSYNELGKDSILTNHNGRDHGELLTRSTIVAVEGHDRVDGSKNTNEEDQHTNEGQATTSQEGSESKNSHNKNSLPDEELQSADDGTFPTFSCGTGWSSASQCQVLCLNGAGCPEGQSCYAGIPCPSSLVASAMGNAGDEILNLIDANDQNEENTRTMNVCGRSYEDAEAKCHAGAAENTGTSELGFSSDFASCENGEACPNGLNCYGGIICPLPPTISPAPTRSPIPEYTVGDHNKNIVAYYAAWQWYDREKLAQPRNLRYDMITRIAYAFFQLDTEGNIWGTDSWADPRILFGDVILTPPEGEVCTTENSSSEGCFCHLSGVNTKSCLFHDYKTSGLIHLAHENGVDVYPSIGGWTLSDPFPAMAASSSARAKFAQNCVELIRNYNFDGIDIDWEYPGYEDHSGTSADTDNFKLLLKAIRDALDELGKTTDKSYGLTAALPCGPGNIANQDVPAVAELLDELNLMTYDFHGAWDTNTGVNAPLYDQAEGDPEPGWSVHGCVENWVGSTSKNSRGEKQRGKVNIGLPFYGRSYLDAKSLYAPHGGIDEINWKEDDGSPQYFNLIARMGDMTSIRDDVTKTQYAYFNNGEGFVTYDDERAICDKADYAISNNLGGFIIWEISGDIMDDLYTPLLEALNRKLVNEELDCEQTFATRQAMSSSSSLDTSTHDVTELLLEEPIKRKDKTDIVGIPVVIAPSSPAPHPVPAAISDESPYTIDKSTLGSVSVAATSCEGGCPTGSSCVGNQAGGQLIKDDECLPCASGQTWWPCDMQGLCWCWLDGTDRIAPAPESGVEIQTTDPHYTACDDILTREIFDAIAPEHAEPYSYTGLCDAILSYNAHHTEKAFGMGDVFQRTAELAAFLGNTLHESDEFRAGREYLMCADRKTVGDVVYCKPCDSGSFDWSTFTCGQSLISGAAEFNEYCQPTSVPPEGCNCGNGKGQSGDLEGFVPANDLYFGRGAIQLSWNYNYIGASIALTGSPDTFCDNPDLVATEGKYAWGAGLFFWMEHSKEGTTSHLEALKMDFGGTLNNINGGLECPAHGGWHEEAVKSRLNRYCRASSALGLPNIMVMDSCAGLDEKLSTCMSEGTCTDCEKFVGSTPGDHPSDFVLPERQHSAVANLTNEEVATEIPSGIAVCDDGLMSLPDRPECCVPNIAFIADGACDPYEPYNTEACGWDGGDCCKQTCNTDSVFGCKTKQGGVMGEYGPFGFFCLDPSQQDHVSNLKNCNIDERERIGDGMCNPMYNTPDCNFDGGDCCEDTCDNEFAYFPCGSGLQSFICSDPQYKIETKNPSPQPIVPYKLTKKPTSSDRRTRRPSVPRASVPTIIPSYMPSSEIIFDSSELVVPHKNDVENSTMQPPVESSKTDCPSDLKKCKGSGVTVGRDPSNKCQFHECPDNKEQMSNDVVSSEEESQRKCPSDFKECKNSGVFVARDPLDNCNFFKCPKRKEEKIPHDSMTTDQLELNSASAVHSDVNNIQEDDASRTMAPSPFPKGTFVSKRCPQDLYECASGLFVGRNPANSCKYFPCGSSFSSSGSTEQGQTVDDPTNSNISSNNMYESDQDSDTSAAASGSLASHDMEERLGLHHKGSDTADTSDMVKNLSLEYDSDSKLSSTEIKHEAENSLAFRSRISDPLSLSSSNDKNDGISLRHSEVILKPTDDASISESHSFSNYGTDDDLKIDKASGKLHALIRFDLTSISPLHLNDIQHVTLRLWSTNSAPISGGSVETTSQHDWNESSVTWSSAPPGNHQFSHTLGPTVAGLWYDLDVTSLVKSSTNEDKIITFRLSTSHYNRAEFASKDFMDGEYSPRLILDIMGSSDSLDRVVQVDLPQNAPHEKEWNSRT